MNDGAERMPIFEPMLCRACGATVPPDTGVLERLGVNRAATSYADCIYKCGCGAGYSNSLSESARVLIWPEPKRNVPEQVHDGLADVLTASCNTFNRRNKTAKFSFETSEDAVTWTILRALQHREALGYLALPLRPEDKASLIMWGAPAGGPQAHLAATELEGISVRLGENPDRRSEPDAIVVWDDLTLVIEAKYRSANECKPGYRNFPRYLDRLDIFAVPTDEVRAAGYYELVRNWRIGIELAERLGTARFELVNLGPPSLKESAGAFASSVAPEDAHAFVHLTWSGLLDRMPEKPAWLESYATVRGLRNL